MRPSLCTDDLRELVLLEQPRIPVPLLAFPSPVHTLKGYKAYSTKGRNDVTGLFVIPPTQRLKLEAEGWQRGLGVLDLNLLFAVGRRERNIAVEEDFHAQTGWR